MLDKGIQIQIYMNNKGLYTQEINSVGIRDHSERRGDK